MIRRISRLISQKIADQNKNYPNPTPQNNPKTNNGESNQNNHPHPQ